MQISHFKFLRTLLLCYHHTKKNFIATNSNSENNLRGGEVNRLTMLVEDQEGEKKEKEKEEKVGIKN